MKGPGDEDYSADEDLTPPVHLVAGEEGEKRPCLVIVAGAQLGEIFPIDGELLIGRDKAAGLRLTEDKGVSRKHCKVLSSGDKVVLVDLGSSNGTYVDGERVGAAERPLAEGAKIRVGQTTVLRYSRFDRAEERAQRQLLDEALRDGLTRAFNRRYFMQRLQAEIRYADRHQQPLCLLLLDVDDFKELNDSHGHQAGDRVLVQASEVVTGMLRVEDVFARYGGEEFAVLARNIPLDAALKMAERLRRQIARTPFLYAGQALAISLSIGVAIATGRPATDDAAEKLVEQADAALYRAKRAGKNRVSS
jgi:diguanylate cyclase (GGDEF)-like protein